MLDFLQKDRFLPNEIVFLPGFGSGESHVGNREKEPDAVVIPSSSLRAFTTKTPWLGSLPDEVNFVGRDFGASRGSRLQQRGKLRHGPFACAKLGKLRARGRSPDQSETFGRTKRSPR